jgi:8-oxo-dGTP pyrophosphatase MutT (NUDIX family)
MHPLSDPRPWKTLETTLIYDKYPYTRIRKEVVALPNGQTIDDYLVLDYPEWVVVMALTADQEFILVRQYRHGIGAVHYELVAGMIEDGETLLDTARRELLEETGFSGGEWQDWLVCSANPGTHSNRAHIFLATGVEYRGGQALDATEELTVHRLPVSEVRTRLEQGEIVQGMHAAALWKWFALEG